MNLLKRFSDGLKNVVANLGTSRDKSSSSFYYLEMIDNAQAINAFRGAWLPKKIVEIPAFDATRAWRQWSGSPDQIEAIEAVEKRFNLKSKVKESLTSARLFGGCAILIGVGDSQPEKPLDPESVGKDGIKYLTVIPASRLTPVSFEDNPESEYYNQPAMWHLSGKNGRSLRIHPSRIVAFQGTSRLSEDFTAATGWGDSVLLSVFEAVRQADGTVANVASLVYEAKVDVIKVPNLMAELSRPEYETALLERFKLAATGKGINGMLLLDKDEDYQAKTVSFATLPEIMEKFFKIVSGASDIPMTRLFGDAPSGMNSTGESDLRNYYDRISASQELDITPAMRILDECIIRAALGTRPKEIYASWSPLWQSSRKEKSEIGKIISETSKQLSDTKLYAQEALAQATMSALAEADAMPGLEGAVEEYGMYEEDGNEEEEAAALVSPKEEPKKEELKDARPRTLYVSRKVINAEEVLTWARSQGIKELVEASELHVTVAYSRTPLDWIKIPQDWSSELTIREGGPRVVEKLGEATCLIFSSDELRWRHLSLKEAGATWDHQDYQPHVTLSYAPGLENLDTVIPYQGKLVLGPELFEEIN